MATRAVSTVVTYRAWDTAANAPKTGDVANHTLKWIKDGTSSSATNTPTEVDATNAKGIYKLTLTSTETDCTFGVLAGVSSTASIAIFGVQVGFEYAPTSATTFGAFIGNATAALSVDGSGRAKADVDTIKTNPVVNAGTITFPTGATLASTTNITAGTVTTATNLTNAPTAGDFTAAMKTSLNAATPAVTVSDKTGFRLSSTGVADVITTALTESYAADGGAPTVAQFLFMIWSKMAEMGISGTTMTTKKLDGATSAMTFTLNDATTPTSITRAT